MSGQDQEYRAKVYSAIKGELGDSFTKTEAEFNTALDNESDYAGKVYGALKGELGDSFSKSEDEFYSLVKKKDETSVASQDGVEESLAPPSTSTQEAELIAGITSESPGKNPLLQRLSASSSWLAAPINYLTGAVRGVGPAVLNVMDGAQKTFYRGVGAALEATGKPGLMVEGALLKEQQDTQDSWWKQASDATTQFANEKMPAKLGGENRWVDEDGVEHVEKSPYKKDAISNLVYGFGEMTPMLMTLYVTPNPSIAGVGMKLPVNFAGAKAMADYSENDDAASAVKEGLIGVGDGAAIMLTGFAGSKAGMGVTRALANKVAPQVAGIGGATTAAATMGTGGFAHSVAGQIASGVHPSEVDYEAARESGLMFTVFGVPGILQAASTTYGGAPSEVIRQTRKHDADVSKLREDAIRLEQESAKETDLNIKAEKAVASSSLHKMADIKAIDELIARDPEAARKHIESQDIPEADKKMWMEKIEDAALNAEYKKQQEGMQDLATAGDDIAKEKAATASKKADQPSSEGNVSLEGEKLTEGVKTPQQEVQERKIAKQQERVDLLDRLERDGESDNIVEAVENLTAKAEKMRETHEPQEVQEALNFIEKVKVDAEVKIALEQTGVEHKISELRAESIGKQDAQKETLGKMKESVKDETIPSKETPKVEVIKEEAPKSPPKKPSSGGKLMASNAEAGIAVMTEAPPKPPKKPPKPPKPPSDIPPSELGNSVEKGGGKDKPEFRKATRKEKREARGTFKEKIIDRRIGINTGVYDTAEKVYRINKKLKPHEREAVSLLIEGAGVPEALKGTKVEEAYHNPRSEVTQAVKMAKEHFDGMWKEIVKNTDKLTRDQVENYVTHIWDIPKGKVGEVASWFATKNRFLKKRYIATLKEGMDKFGLKPKTLDVGEIMKIHSSTSRMVIENNKFIKDLKKMDIGGMPVMATHKKAPKGYIEYKHPALTYKQYKGDGFDGKPVVVERYYKIHPDMKSAFDVIFSDGKLGVESLDRIWDGYLKVGDYLKKTALSLSLFHHGALTETAIANTGPLKTAKTLSKDVLWDGITKGKPAFSNPEVARKAVEHGVQLGAASDFDVAMIQKHLDQLAKATEKVPGLAQGTKAFAGFNRVWDRQLWDYLHDGLKVHAFESMSANVKMEGKTPEQYTKQLREIGQLVNDTYGGQNWDVLMKSPMSLKLMRSVLLSPDWTISTVRQALSPTGAGTLYNNDSFWKLAKKGTPANMRRQHGTKFWLRAALYYGVGINLLNAVNRKKDMEENPQYYKDDDMNALGDDLNSLEWEDKETWKAYKDNLMGRTMRENTIGHKTHLFAGRYEDGTERYIRWGKQFRELPELLMDESGVNFPRPALQKIGGKAAPQAQLISQALTGKTMSGYENYDMQNKEGWDYTMGLMKTVAKAALPYSSASIFRDDREWKPIDLMMPSSKGMTASKAEKLFLAGIDAQDPQFVSEVYEGAVRNNLDAYTLFEVAMRRHSTTLTREAKAVSDDAEELEALIAKEEDPKKQMALIDKLVDLQVREVDIAIARQFHDLAMTEMELYTSQYNKKWGMPDDEGTPSKE